MPLDVQPLSRGRRAVMVVVLIGILAASLGLAQFLTLRAQRRGVMEPRRVMEVKPPPPGDDD